MSHRWIVCVWASVAALGCVDQAPTVGAERDELSGAGVSKQLFERALRSAEHARAAQAGRDGFAAALLATTAPDAVYLAAGHPIVRGKPAIAALLAADDPAHARRATFEPRRITASADGLLGTTFGWNVFTTAAPDGTVTTTYGSYTTMWRRQGWCWQMIVHVQNATTTPPTEAPDDFAVLDDAPPVIRLAAPETNAAEVAATDRAFAAANVAEGGAVATPAFAAEAPAEALFGHVYYGFDQVAAAHAGDVPPAVAVLDFAPIDTAATFTGDLGYADGTYVVRLTSNGASVAFGTYLTVYQRQPDGGWKWVLANSNPSPAP